MLEKLVAFCLRWPWTVVLLTLCLTAGGVYVTAERFAIDTETGNLFSPDIPWRKNEAALYKAFPDLLDVIVVVLDGKTSEEADDAAKRLNAALQASLLSRVWRPDEHEYFRKNGCCSAGPRHRKHVGVMIGQREFSNRSPNQVARPVSVLIGNFKSASAANAP
jgi:hypothetical protein